MEMGDNASSSGMKRIIANGKYQVMNKIGSGSFGTIYNGLNLLSGERVAIKVEFQGASVPQLLHESQMYRTITDGFGFPRLKWFGQEGVHNFLVLDLLGHSLEDLFNMCSRKFTLKTVLLLFEQMISRVQFLHSKGYIHRDLKPDNFLMGRNRCSRFLFLIDFGLSTRYRKPFNGNHVPFRTGRSLTGTARYASINSHQGKQQSRRDDLESLGYIMVYFLKGGLPWQGLRGRNQKQKYERIYEVKMTIPVEQLCKNLPQEFIIYFNYCRQLKFSEAPNYNYLRHLFKSLFSNMKYMKDYQYDWVVLNNRRRSR